MILHPVLCRFDYAISSARLAIWDRGQVLRRRKLHLLFRGDVLHLAGHQVEEFWEVDGAIAVRVHI